MAAVEGIVDGATWYMVFLFSITCHEAAHAVASTAGGDSTAEDQVTLLPAPHLRQEPVGTIVVPLLSLAMGSPPIGWASAPHSVYWAERYPKRALITTLAGPIANLLVALVAALLIQVGIFLEIFYTPEAARFDRLVSPASPLFAVPAHLISILLSLNLTLFVFNLLPFPPLDGFHILRGVVRDEWRETLSQMTVRVEGYIFGLLFASVVMNGVSPALFRGILVLLFPWVSYG